MPSFDSNFCPGNHTDGRLSLVRNGVGRRPHSYMGSAKVDATGDFFSVFFGF